MRRLVRSAVAAVTTMAAACGASTGPVKGATEAFDRHYRVTVAEAHTAVTKVLADRYTAIASDDGRHIMAQSACRTERGNPCVDIADGGPTADSAAPPTVTTTIIVIDYWFQVYAGVVGDDGDVQIQIGGHARDVHGDHRELQVGEPGEPAWMPHEVDLVRMDIDKALTR